MSEQLTPQSFDGTKIPKRYQNPQIIEHLASQYVLGTLTRRVHQRVDTLARCHETLFQCIESWQSQLVYLDHQTKELPPSEHVWQNIAHSLESSERRCEIVDEVQQTSSDVLGVFEQARSLLKFWLTKSSIRLVSGASFAMLVVFMLFIYKPFNQSINPLSYVAVLTEDNGQAHVVATTYGASKKLIVNVIGKPVFDKEQSLELWVVSKLDSEARSLGVLPTDKPLIEQQLTDAQWRLIKDSESLIVTIEELGGSAIGEPSSLIVSRGLCIRLQEWEKGV